MHLINTQFYFGKSPLSFIQPGDGAVVHEFRSRAQIAKCDWFGRLACCSDWPVSQPHLHASISLDTSALETA